MEGRRRRCARIGCCPRWALVVQGYTPTSGPSSQSTLVVGESFGWRFANGWEWTTAMRYGTGFDAGDAFDQWAPSSVVKVPLGERWNVHAEYFAIVSTQKEIPLNIHYASIGGHVLATDDLEIGVLVGWGLNDTSPAFFTNLGVGWRYWRGPRAKRLRDLVAVYRPHVFSGNS